MTEWVVGMVTILGLVTAVEMAVALLSLWVGVGDDSL